MSAFISPLPRNFPCRLWINSREGGALAFFAPVCTGCLAPTRFFITKMIRRIGDNRKGWPVANISRPLKRAHGTKNERDPGVARRKRRLPLATLFDAFSVIQSATRLVDAARLR